jgi:hypothetical protein
MKWLPTSLILFSVGAISVIAETAVAKPWESFVSDQQIFEAQTIRCDFTKGVGANWDGAEPRLEFHRDGFGSEFLFDPIGDREARSIGNAGSEDVHVIRTEMGLTLIEKTSAGFWNTTTVFGFRDKKSPNRFAAVTSKHVNSFTHPTTSQYYGLYKVLEYHK